MTVDEWYRAKYKREPQTDSAVVRAMRKAFEAGQAAHLEAMLSVVEASRELSGHLHGVYNDPEYFAPEIEILQRLDVALASVNKVQ